MSAAGVAASRRKWAHHLARTDLCRRCAKQKAAPGHVYCDPCLRFHAARGRAKYHRAPEYGAVFVRALVGWTRAMGQRELQ